MEGAGGLLSPLGEDFDSRDLIVSLRATPVVVCANRLGAINQVLLVLAALPRLYSRRARVVLMTLEPGRQSDHGSFKYLKEKLGAERVFELPYDKINLHGLDATLARPEVRRVVESLVSKHLW